MIAKNYSKIIKVLQGTDKVLDIGGWERPFNRANYVLDILPYSTRKKQNSYPREMREHFSKKTWIIHDIADRLPFKDNEFDYVICGHVLEDIKDPIRLCSELIRVAKSGYIEFPCRAYEMRTCVDPYVNSHRYVGYCHHRWLIEVVNNGLYFVPKNAVHSAISPLRCRKVTHKFTGFFWENSFNTKEFFFSSHDDIVRESIKFRSRNDCISYEYLLKKYYVYKLFRYPFVKFFNIIKNGRIKDE